MLALVDALKNLSAQLQQVIQQLESAQNLPRCMGLKRGRKSMGAVERLEVADRMRKYWAARRGQTQ